MTVPKDIRRMCAVTRRVLPKAQLIRLVRTPQGAIRFDAEQNLCGRGMYVQADMKIIRLLFSKTKKGLWKHALKTDPSEDQKESLFIQISDTLFPSGKEAPAGK